MTVIVAWYQSYATEKEAASAELERAKAVSESAVAIVEEHVLNGKAIQTNRLVRLINKRRRDEKISIPITASDVVERAEFNIESSHHLSIDRKEQIKPLFDAFYADLRTRAFRPFPSFRPNAELLNEIATKIQGGKSAEALAALKRLDEARAQEVADTRNETMPRFFKAVESIVSSPTKLTLALVGLLLYFWAARRLLDSYAFRRFRSRVRYGF